MYLIVGIHIDGGLDFDYQVSQICKKARKNYTSSKLCKVMDQNKQRIFMKWFTILRLPYCLLVWILPSRNTKNRANKIFERALKLVYDDSPYLSFDELQIKTNRLASIKDLICFWQLQSFCGAYWIYRRHFSVCKLAIPFTKKIFRI